MKFCTIDLNLKNVTGEIAQKVGSLGVEGDSRPGKWMSFSLKETLTDPVNSFLYDGQLYMVNSVEDENKYHCVAIDFKRL